MEKVFRIIENDGGNESIVADDLHTFEEVKQVLIEAKLYNWIVENDLEFELPNFESCESWQELGYKLERINNQLTWWSVVVQQKIDNAWEALNPRYTNGWHGQ